MNGHAAANSDGGPLSAFAALGRTKTTLIVLALHAALGLAATGVALLDVLGFERALASALLSTATSPLLGIAAVRRGRLLGGEPLRWWGAAAAWSVLALLPSVIAGFLYELATLPCDLEQGAVFFVLLGGGNLLFGTTLGFVLGLGFGTSTRRARLAPVLIAYAVDLAWLGATLLRLYREPQIFAFSTPWGHWPGSLYDEAIALGPALFGFRAFGLLLSLGLLALARSFTSQAHFRLSVRPRVSALAVGLACLGGALWIHSHGRRLGFDLDREAIIEVLGRRVETEHFVLQVDPTLPERAVEALALEHELRWRDLRAFFGTAPAERITSFVYRDPAQKGRLMGGARTQIARPWIGEIHIHGAEVPHPVLEHELAHIFAGELVDSPFRIPLLFGVVPNIGLIEGLAVAADAPVRELTLHQWAAAMLALDRLPAVGRTLDPAGFWSISSARAYTALGSFVSWLIDEEGMDGVAKTYGGASFEEAFGAPAETLEARWRGFLTALPLSEAALRLAEHRFSRPSIFGKTCARASATLRQSAYARLEAGDLGGAAPSLETLYTRARSDPGPLVSLGRAYLRSGDLERARALATRARATPGATERALAAALELEGEIAWKAGELDAARARFLEVGALRLSAGSDRMQAARLAALSRPPVAREVLRAYLGGELSPGRSLVELEALADARPEDPLVRYLLARRLEAAGAPDSGLAWADRPDALPTAPLRDEARLMRARLALLAGTPTTAVALFERAELATEDSAVRALAIEGRERAQFWADAGE